MSSTTFTDGITVVPASWLNDVNTTVYSTINIKTFGAKVDGVTDDTAAWIAAVAANLGKSIFIPPGISKISAEIPVNGSITIFGAGREISIIQMSSTTQNGFNVHSNGAVHFRDFQIIGSASQTAGAGIKLNGATNGVTTNAHSSFSNMGFLFNWHGIEIISAAQWNISFSQFFGILDAGIVCGDSVFPDSGDNWITKCMLTGNSASATIDGIRHTAGGGLHIVDNSFIVLGTAYRMAWGSAIGSSQIFLHSNTVDSTMSAGGFIFDRTSSGTVFAISIKNNYLSPAAAVPSIWFKTNNASVFSQVTISGNTYLVATGGTGIQIDGGQIYSIIGEQFVANSTGTGIATGNATATLIYVGKNQFQGITTPFSINTASQLSSYYDALTLGTVGNPSLVFFNSLTTGFYQPAADQIGISIAGTQRTLITSGGTTVTGTTSSTGEIRNTSAADASPFTQTRLTLYRDASNWGYLGYGNDTIPRFVVGKTGNNTALSLGTSSALDGTGTYTETLKLSSGIVDSSSGSLVLKGAGTTGVTIATTGATSIVGTPTNDSASSGQIGEYLSTTVATPGVTLGTGTTSNIATLSLTAGDWDVTGTIAYLFGATTSYTNLVGGISITSATLGPQGNSFDYETSAIVPTAGADSVWVVPTVRVSLAGTTNVFLVAQATFTVSSLKAYGIIRARRMR